MPILSLNREGMHRTLRACRHAVRTAPPGALLAGAFVALLVGWLLAPLWGAPPGTILGSPSGEAVNGLWSLDHVSRSLLAPWQLFWSPRVGFPEGSWGTARPLLTGIALAPVSWAFDVRTAWNAGVVLSLLSTGFAVAWLARRWSGVWWTGFPAVAAAIAQPMSLGALHRGSLERIAAWSFPVLIAVTLGAVSDARPRRAAFAGCAVLLVALESPVWAISAGVALTVAMLALPPRRPRRAGRWSARAMVVWAACAVVSYALARGICDSEGASAARLASESTNLQSWWRYATGNAGDGAGWVEPTFFPGGPLLAMAVVGLAGGAGSRPWWVAGAVLLTLSFGLSPTLGDGLRMGLGPVGLALAAIVGRLNRVLWELPPFDLVGSPALLLVPSMILVAVSASVALGRLARTGGRLGPPFALVLSVVLAVWTTGSSARALQHGRHFPSFMLPRAAFASWIGHRRGAGGVLVLPQRLPAPGDSGLAPFAGLAGLGGADPLYFQTLHHRPIVEVPGMSKFTPPEFPTDVAALLTDWSDLARPRMVGSPVPPTATDKGRDEPRRRAFDRLLEEGLRWVVIDVAAYESDELAELRRQLGTKVKSSWLFADGSGVLVVLVSPG